MTTIELKSKPLKDIIDNQYVIKMILNYSVEKQSDLFLGLMKIRKKIMPLEFCDKYIRYSLIVKKSSSRRIGFILELKEDDNPNYTFNMHSIYIIPEERKKGYCNQVLELYSKYQSMIIADALMTKIILKLQDKTDECLYILNPRMNKDGSRKFHTKTHKDIFILPEILT